MSVVNDDAFRVETNADSDSDSNVSSDESEGGMLIDEEIMNVTAKAKSAAPPSKETTPTKQEPLDSDESDLDEPKKRGKKRKRGGKDIKVKRPRTAYMYFMQVSNQPRQYQELNNFFIRSKSARFVHYKEISMHLYFILLFYCPFKRKILYLLPLGLCSARSAKLSC